MTEPSMTEPSMTEPSGPVSSVADEATEASTTVPLPAFRRHLLQITSPASPAALGGANPAARVVRRLMVTPWFAVATGFVVAAGLWIYSPHAELNIPNGAIGRTPCKFQGCGITSPNNHAAAGGSLLPMTGSVDKFHPNPTAPRLKLGYRVIRQSQGRFSLLITVSGTSVPHSWQLAFALPGDSITFVQGASWQPSGRYGAIVTWPALDNPWQLGGQSRDEHDRHRSRTSAENGDSFIISGVGVVVSPDSCSFNGRSCEISQLS
jgi:hypothetical protein